MKKLILAAAVAWLLCASAFAQSKQADLDKVFALLDRSSEGFKAVEAKFQWDQYQSVVDEHDKQSGTMYFKRTAGGVDIAADITSPFPKKMVFSNGVVELYTPKTGQLDRHDVSKNRKSFESFLALGFGGTSRDLLKNFDVRYAGIEPVNNKPCYKLELTPKAADVRNMFPHITLWINQQNGMSEQQKLDQGEGDYRVATYSAIVLNPPKLPENAFVLKGK